MLNFREFSQIEKQIKLESERLQNMSKLCTEVSVAGKSFANLIQLLFNEINSDLFVTTNFNFSGSLHKV